MRVTTNGTLRTYKSDLMRASNNLSNARTRVLTQRNFNSYAEDPSSATLAFKLRRQFSNVNNQLTNTNSLINRFHSAWTAVGTIKGLVETAVKDAALRGDSDSVGSGRRPLAETLAGTAKSIVQTLNNKYGESFIFAGNDGMNVPFSWSDTGELLFRGIPVDSGGNTPPKPEGAPPRTTDVTAGSEWEAYYNAYPEYAVLVDTTYETSYIDVGAGLSEHTDGTLNTATVFNSAINALDILGFGVDQDGDPLNTVSLIKELSDILYRCDADSGDYANDEDKADALRLTKKLEDALNNITNKWTDLDGQSTYLEATKSRLTMDGYSINEQILSLEQVDLAEAITDFSWAQYCYNAALKVGNDIISQSLIDYMR